MKSLLKTLFFFVLLTQICFGQWVQVGLSGETIKDIAVRNATIFAVTNDGCYGSWYHEICHGKLYRSIDNGLNWQMIIDSNVVDVAISPTGKVLMIKDSVDNVKPYFKTDVFISLNNGDNWVKINITEQIADSLYYYSNYLILKLTIGPEGIIYSNIGCWGFSANYQDIIARSIDDGNTWQTPGMSFCIGRFLDFRNQNTISIGYCLMPGAFSNHWCLSTDNGNNWSIIETYLPAAHSCLGYFSNGNIIFDRHWTEGIYIVNVVDTTFNLTHISSLIPQTGQSFSSGLVEGMLLGTEDLGVFLFSDEGDSLGSRNEGLTNLNIKTLTLDDNGYVYAGTGNGIWRRPLIELVTSVANEPTQPTEYFLSQNYPNPFNPATKINYALPSAAMVELKVYNVLGQLITTLVNEENPAGVYEVDFNATDLPSGVYIYKIQAGDFVQSRKMLLLK